MVKFRLSPSVIILLLTMLGFGLRLTAATADPFLHPWDERFHALVARNMISDPWTPRLRPGLLLPFDYRVWCCNDVWLHKQPLFLWQMALSMKAFGVGLVQMRLPSVLLSTLMIPFVWHLSLMAGVPRRASLWAAALMAFNGYHIELAGGYYGMDHNDVAFSFYILASVWTFFRYRIAKSLKWVLLTGIFAGAAILCKWLVGLVVLAIWAVAAFRENDRAVRRASLLNLSLASLTAVLVSLPWQLYILHNFPTEARYEYAFSTQHLTDVIEEQGGGWSFYLERFPQYFGNILFLFVPAGVLLALSPACRRVRGYGLVAILSVTGFCFYSFMPATKVQSFMAPFIPPALVLSAASLSFLADRLRARKCRAASAFASCVCIAFIADQAVQLLQHHAPGDRDRVVATRRTAVYRSLSRYLRPGTAIVLAVPEREEVDVMFFNKGIVAHSWAPEPKEFQIYAQRGTRIAYFAAADGYTVPGYVRSYWNAYEIPVTLP